MDQCQEKKVTPLAWSPLGAGLLGAGAGGFALATTPAAGTMFVTTIGISAAIALLRIAARLSTDPEQRLIDAVAELLAWSDPEELDPCADEAHDAVDEYTTFQRGV